jgi:hypothetical protein
MGQSKMSWTEKQCAAIFDSYWNEYPSSCPECNAPLHPQYSPVRSTYVLEANCPVGHGSLQMGPENDPLAEQFRQWKDAEVATIIQKHQAGTRPVCPADGAFVDITEAPHAGGVLVAIKCRRCGQLGRKDIHTQ